MAFVFLEAVVQAQPAHAGIDEQTRDLAHAIFKQLIDINTTESDGNVTAASEAMRQRLLDAGFAPDDLFVGGPDQRKKNLVVRYRGTGEKRPILFIGHLDVVEAPRVDWSTDPFELVEKDGFYYGRGTQDMKGSDAILVTMLIRMKQEGYRPNRDLIVALTADEETGSSNGVLWLLDNHRDLVDAEFVLNPDAGGIDMEDGKVVSVNVSAVEKLYGDYQFTVTHPGGHSSMPVPENAIYRLADALVRLQNYQFPLEMSEISEAYCVRMSQAAIAAEKAEDLAAVIKSDPDPAIVARLSQDPQWNAMLRTTCVATQVQGGHAANALPQLAEANVNCRILPGHTLEDVRKDLIRIVGDPEVKVRYKDGLGVLHDVAPEKRQLPPPPLNAELMDAVDKVTAGFWPGVPVVPFVNVGASDNVYTSAAGLPTYGISGIPLEISDYRAHGKDERVPVESFYRGLEFYYALARALSGG